MKQITILFFILTFYHVSEGQRILALQECYDLAEHHYPLIRQRQLIEQTKAYSVENAGKGSLPQLMIGGQATYQSEVTQIPVEMPGVQRLSKDQYRIFGEVSQTLYHGGLVAQKRQMETTNAEADEQKLKVELYQLRSRINDLFFGVLMMQELVAQSQLIKQDLQTGLKKVEAAITNGTAIPGAADVIRAELLRLDQRIIEMESSASSYRQLLGLFINVTVDQGTILQKPSFDNVPSTLNRPEVYLFEHQKRNIDASMGVLSASKKPRVDLFVQGGYGRPGLNMLENEFTFYYLGGIRFTWQLSAYYTFNKEREILNLRNQGVDLQKETFLFNTQLTLSQHAIEIAKLQRLINADDEIIALRTRIKKTAAVQLEEGVITVTDYIREVNAEEQAKQNRVLHEVQLLLARAKHLFTLGQ